MYNHQALSHYQSQKNENGDLNFTLVLNEGGRTGAIGEKENMGRTDSLNRRLRSFRDVTGQDGPKRPARHLRLEFDNQSDEITDVQYFVTGLPKE